MFQDVRDATSVEVVINVAAGGVVAVGTTALAFLRHVKIRSPAPRRARLSRDPPSACSSSGSRADEREKAPWAKSQGAPKGKEDCRRFTS